MLTSRRISERIRNLQRDTVDHSGADIHQFHAEIMNL